VHLLSECKSTSSSNDNIVGDWLGHRQPAFVLTGDNTVEVQYIFTCNLKLKLKTAVSRNWPHPICTISGWTFWKLETSIWHWLLNICCFQLVMWKICATTEEMRFPPGCDTMWRHEVLLKWPFIRHLSVNLVAQILIVNINYFYNSDDEKLVITLHDKWGPIIYRLVLKLLVIFIPKTVT